MCVCVCVCVGMRERVCGHVKCGIRGGLDRPGVLGQEAVCGLQSSCVKIVNA